MSCRVSAYEKLITIHVLLEGVGENKSRVVRNCAHFSRFRGKKDIAFTESTRLFKMPV